MTHRFLTYSANILATTTGSGDGPAEELQAFCRVAFKQEEAP